MFDVTHSKPPVLPIAQEEAMLDIITSTPGTRELLHHGVMQFERLAEADGRPKEEHEGGGNPGDRGAATTPARPSWS